MLKLDLCRARNFFGKTGWVRSSMEELMFTFSVTEHHNNQSALFWKQRINNLKNKNAPESDLSNYISEKFEVLFF
jgi:hypothetical protein